MAEANTPTPTTETTTTPATVTKTPAAVVEPIPRWDSKTYWLNGLMVIAALATTAYYLWKNGGSVTPESFTAMFAAVWSAIQLVLRETTSAPLQGLFDKKTAALVLFVSLLLGGGASAATHTDNRIVPDVCGMPLAFAKAEVTEAGFNLKQSRPFWKGAVVGEQDPKPGEKRPFDGFVVVAPKDSPKEAPKQAPVSTPPIAADADDHVTPLPMEQPVPAVPAVEKSVIVKSESKPLGNHTKRTILPDDLPDGVYILKVVGGVKTLEVAEEMVLNGPPPGPGPTPVPPVPPVPPSPPPLTDFGKAIKAAADKATGDSDRVNTAQGLAMLYSSIATEAHKKDTQATVETVFNTTLQVTDIALSKQGAAAVTAWADERAALRAAMADAVAKGDGEGKPLSVGKLGDLLDQAVAGLQASAPKTGNQAPSPAFWDFLLKLITLLLDMLKPKA